MKKLFVDSFIKDQSPNIGQSRPLLIQASDGELYFIKNNKVNDSNGWKTENAMFFHEVLGHNLAKYLNVNVPDIVILEIEQDIMTANSDLLFQRNYKPGLYFGTKRIDNVEDNLFENFKDLLRLNKPYIRRPWNQFFKNIDNSEIVPSIIVMDLLLSNFDRFDNKGNLVIGSNEKGRLLYAIDHGHCFKGPFFNFEKEKILKSNILNTQEEIMAYIDREISLIIEIAQGNGSYRPFNLAGEIFKAIENHVNLENPDNHSFMEPVYLVEKLDRDIINSMMAEIPNEWTELGNSQKKLYSDFILRQAKLIKPMIQRLAYLNAFSNYRGGELNWKVDVPTGTQ